MKHFRLAAASGIIAAAEGGATDVIFAFHNNAANVLHVQRVRAILSAVTPPTVGQEAAIELALATFTTDFTDGQDLSDPATAANYAVRNRNLDKLRVLQSTWRPTSSLATGNVRIASTIALTGATPTVDAHAFAHANRFFGAAAGNVAPLADLLWESPTLGQDYERPGDGCIPLEEDRGFVIRLPFVLGAAFTARLAIAVDWIET